MDVDLDNLLKRARAKWDAMSPAEQDEMIRMQCRAVARAEASWPKPKYKWVDGVKVYESYEDYLND